VPMEVKRLTEVSPYLKILVYGKPGVGKTVFASTAPRPLFVDFEAGTLSITGKPIDVVSLTSYIQLYEIYMELYDRETGQLKGNKYDSLVIDSLTEVQKLNMDMVLSSGVEAKPTKDRDVPELRDYQKSMAQIGRLVRAFRNLPMNIIFTALPVEVRDEKTGIITAIKPSLPGKLSDEVAAYMDIIGYLWVEDVTGENGQTKKMRKLLTQPSEPFYAKDRSPGGKLGTIVEEPTIPKIMEMIYGPKDKNAKEVKK